MKHKTPKQDVLELAPNAEIRTSYELHKRTFRVWVGDRILASGIGAQATWRRAFEILKGERT